jgi:hypothetical protein
MILDRRQFLSVIVSVLALGTMVESSEVSISELERFLTLSSELTGFGKEELDPELARLYLDSLREVEPGSLKRLLTNSEGDTPEELEQLNYRVAELWFSGVRPTLKGSELLAYEDSLGWMCIDFARPPTYCGPAWGAA